jgi:uncharacterized SAM-binding protein YcdF (DUF218 family)
VPNYLLNQILLLLEPIGFIWACLIIVAIYHLFRRHWRLATIQLLIAAIIFLFGSTGFPGLLMQELEKPYIGFSVESAPKADAIVMLGGGTEPSRYEVAGMHLTPAADRLIMAMELARLGKAPTLVLGGGGADLDGEFRGESEMVRRWMTDRKAVPAEVLALKRCRDTHDEALQILALAEQRGWQQVLLVTSANHMRRAVATFRTAGVRVVPAPCNFVTELSLSPSPRGVSVPRAGGFEYYRACKHEQGDGWYYSKSG